MADYGKAITLPFSDFKKLSIGAVLWMIPVVNLITGLFAIGYLLNVSKHAMKKKYVMPEWKGMGDLFVKGLLAMVISLIYSIPVAIGALLLFLSVGAAILTGIAQGNSAAVISLISASIGGFLLLLIIFVLVLYVTPAAIFGYIRTGSFGAAFDFRTVFGKAFRRSWLLSFLFVLVWSAALGTVFAIISAVTSFTIVLPFVFQAYFTFASMITGYTLLGESYGEK